jgi:hypothetical protein
LTGQTNVFSAKQWVVQFEMQGFRGLVALEISVVHRVEVWEAARMVLAKQLVLPMELVAEALDMAPQAYWWKMPVVLDRLALAQRRRPPFPSHPKRRWLDFRRTDRREKKRRVLCRICRRTNGPPPRARNVATNLVQSIKRQ